MYQFSNRTIKILKIIHLLGAACWFGGACSMVTMNLTSALSTSTQMLFGINMASHMVDMWIVVRFGVYICILSGFIYGLFTSFGFFKHKWILAKWIITVYCFLSGWLLLGNYENALLALSSDFTTNPLLDDLYLIIKNKSLYFSLLQVVLLGCLFVISVYKPWRKAKSI